MIAQPHYRILLVEDEPTDVLVLRASFADQPEITQEFVEAGRLAQARVLLQNERFDVALLDLGLPDSQGLETFTALHELAPDLPVLVLTGLNDEAVGIRAMQLGAQDYIVKGMLQPILLGRTVRYAIERQHNAAEMRHSREQLRLLADRLVALREEERTRISREIHDELGQQLTGLKMDLRSIERKILPFVSSEQFAVISPALADAKKLADSTIETVQRIAIELRPSTLDNLGLAAAMRDELQRFIRRTAINVTSSLPDDLSKLPAPIATAFFRIFQELITNVARHSGAHSMEVRLAEVDRHLILEIRDDGRGFSPEAMHRSTSLGLLGMSERAIAIGGQINFDSTPDGGTLAKLRAPLDQIHSLNPPCFESSSPTTMPSLAAG